MIQLITQIIYDSTPIEFKSDFPLQESVKRLSDATSRPVFSTSIRQRAVGSVTKSRVSLHRVIPFVNNSFKPFFVGHFKDAGGKVVLSGQFSIHIFVKIFMTFWLGFCLLGNILAVVQAFTSGSEIIRLLLPGLGMFLGGIALVLLGKHLSRNDVAWLSNVIKKSLTKNVN